MPFFDDSVHRAKAFFDDDEIYQAPLLEVHLLLNGFRVSKNLADGIDLAEFSYGLIDDIQFLCLEDGRSNGGSHFEHQLPIISQVVPKPIAFLFPAEFSTAFRQVLNAKLHGMAEIVAGGIYNCVNYCAWLFRSLKNQEGCFEIAMRVVVEVVWSAVKSDAGIVFVILMHTPEQGIFFEVIHVVLVRADPAGARLDSFGSNYHDKIELSMEIQSGNWCPSDHPTS